MKKILSIFLSISILSVVFFGSYLSVSASGDSDFYKYLQVGEVSDHDKGIYDSVYGSNGWYTDSDGYLWIDKSNNAYNSTSSKVMMSMVPYSGVSASYTAVSSAVNKLYRANKLFDWVNDHKGDMNLKNGILSVGQNAMSAFKDVFRNNCVDLGSYRVISNNISKNYILEVIASRGGSSSTQESCLKKLNSYDSYFIRNASSNVNLHCLFFNSSSNYFLVWDNFEVKSDNYMYFYSVSKNDLVYQRIGDYYISPSGTFNYSSDMNLHAIPPNLSYSYHGQPMKVFGSTVSAKMYYGILNSDSTTNFYFYDNYSPTNINVNLSTVKNTNYEQVFNNTYNTINEEKIPILRIILLSRKKNYRRLSKKLWKNIYLIRVTLEVLLEVLPVVLPVVTLAVLPVVLLSILPALRSF